MSSTPEPPSSRRRPHSHTPRELHNQSYILLVTVCARDRKPLFARQAAMQTLLSAWEADKHWLVGRHVLLTDHMHFFCAPGQLPQPPLDLWMKKWKAHAGRNWPVPSEHPLWQRSHWDRQLRDIRHYDERWEYVRQNPVRSGLCTHPDEWPFQGELHRLIL